MRSLLLRVGVWPTVRPSTAMLKNLAQAQAQARAHARLAGCQAVCLSVCPVAYQGWLRSQPISRVIKPKSY